jgi:hypothetical protein
VISKNVAKFVNKLAKLVKNFTTKKNKAYQSFDQKNTTKIYQKRLLATLCLIAMPI